MSMSEEAENPPDGRSEPLRPDPHQNPQATSDSMRRMGDGSPSSSTVSTSNQEPPDKEKGKAPNDQSNKLPLRATSGPMTSATSRDISSSDGSSSSTAAHADMLANPPLTTPSDVVPDDTSHACSVDLGGSQPTASSHSREAEVPQASVHDHDAEGTLPQGDMPSQSEGNASARSNADTSPELGDHHLGVSGRRALARPRRRRSLRTSSLRSLLQVLHFWFEHFCRVHRLNPALFRFRMVPSFVRVVLLRIERVVLQREASRVRQIFYVGIRLPNLPHARPRSQLAFLRMASTQRAFNWRRLVRERPRRTDTNNGNALRWNSGTSQMRRPLMSMPAEREIQHASSPDRITEDAIANNRFQDNARDPASGFFVSLRCVSLIARVSFFAAIQCYWFLELILCIIRRMPIQETGSCQTLVHNEGPGGFISLHLENGQPDEQFAEFPQQTTTDDAIVFDFPEALRRSPDLLHDPTVMSTIQVLRLCRETGNHRHPIYPRMRTIRARLRSLQDWPRPCQAWRLALAGFFAARGNDDFLTCFHCGGVIGNCVQDDNPWILHRSLFPRCRHIRTSWPAPNQSGRRHSI